MSIFTNILSRLGYIKTAQVVKPSPWQQAEAQEESWNYPDLGVITNQADLYRVLSWVFAAIEAKSNMASSVELNVKKLEGEKVVDIPNHPFEALMRKPNPMQSRSALWYDTFAYRSLTGNAYWWLNRTSGNAPPDEIWLIPSDRIRPVADTNLYLKGYMYQPGGGAGEIPLEPWEIVQFKRWNPHSRYIGMSEIESIALSATGDIAAQKWNVNYFGKDNAKIPGILAFGDPVGDPEWQRIRHEVATQYTGVQRRLMLLRGVGTKVNFLPNSISQKDMEFLAGRTFSKEEIWTVLAPGLASMLAVNATEANANAGERTFRALAVWPLLTHIAEQITLDILPCYGEGLVAQFEDVRITDKAMNLQERAAFERVHTVDEVREKYDEADPLKDNEIGGMLVAIANSPAGAPKAETPEQLVPFAGNQQPPTEEVKPGNEQQPKEDEQVTPELSVTPEELPETVKAELGRWQRKAIKALARGKQASVPFDSTIIPEGIRDTVIIGLGESISEDDIKETFADVNHSAIKASVVRRTIAGLVDADGESKNAAEARIMRLMKAKLNGQLQDVLDLIGDPPDFTKLTDEWWNTQAGKMLASLRPEIEKMMHVAAETMIDNGVGVDWSLVAVRAAEYASGYSFKLIKDITDQTRKIMQNAINDFVRTPGMTRADLESQIAPWFGEVRASRIAVTEVTRAYAEGEKLAAQEAKDVGLNLSPVWHTREDELVCPICADLDMKNGDELGASVPPAHPNCRCWITHDWIVGAKS
jgi:HK97 family phage portal protein